MFVFVKRIVGGLCVRREHSGDIFPKQSVFQHGAHLWAKLVGIAPAIHPAARSCVGKKRLNMRVYGVVRARIILVGVFLLFMRYAIAQKCVLSRYFAYWHYL